MPEGPDGKTIIIIKKVSGHGGGHGGAWKVAYADFVTAMMALFMVLWLVNSAAEPTRQRIASYFRKPGIFQKGSGTPMEMGGGGILPDAFSPPADGNAQIQASEKIYDVNAEQGRVRDLYDPGEGSKEFRYAPKINGTSGKGTTEKDIFEKGQPGVDNPASSTESQIQKNEESKLQELKTEIEKAIEESKANSQTEGVLGDIEIKVDQRGLVIEIMDTEKVSMFASGQAVIQPEAQKKLNEISKILMQVPNAIDIEGHTDGNPFRNKKNGYDNWSLSTDRANAARRALEEAGFKHGQIARVVGYADERLKDPTNPLNPSNRRITISMRYSSRAKVALDGKQVFETSTNKKKEQVSHLPKEAATPATQATVVATPSPETKASEAEEGGEEAEAKPVQTQKGLKVEVSTVVPEDAEIVEDSPKIADENKKSLIFESSDAFFKK